MRQGERGAAGELHEPDHALVARQLVRRVRVTLGGVSAPALLGKANLGTVALIAPTRIQYQEMIHAVRYIAQLSGRLLDVSPD